MARARVRLAASVAPTDASKAFTIATLHRHTDARWDIGSRGCLAGTWISKDDGKTWSKSGVIEGLMTGWYCYVSMTFDGDRVILSYMQRDTSLKENIRGKRLRAGWDDKVLDAIYTGFQALLTCDPPEHRPTSSCVTQRTASWYYLWTHE